MNLNFYTPDDEYGYLHENIPLVIDLFKSSDRLLSFFMTCDMKAVGSFLGDLGSAVVAIHQQIMELLPLVRYPNKLKEISMNMPMLVDRLKNLYATEKYEEFNMKLQCEFRPLFLNWGKSFNFFMVQCINEERIREYNSIEAGRIALMAKEPKKDIEKEYKYDLSIVVLFYGKREMTGDCIDAINKYTKNYTYELITIDNGSDEETTNWCNSLPHFKKVHYPVNIGSSSAGNTTIYFSKEFIEGKFLVFVANDIIVTENWAKSLYECMVSDESIIWATPVMNSISNRQAIPVPYKNNNLDDMHRFAREYNNLNPLKWEERARLFAAMGIIRQEEVSKFYDYGSPYFCYDMFSDDDTSIRYKRAGYKQILCRDVFVHHYGSATIGDYQFEIMDLGREQFYKKYSLDAWVSISDKSVFFPQFIKETCDSNRILSMEPRFGEGTLAIKNRLKELGCKDIIIDTVTANSIYLPDMQALFNNAFLLSDYDEVIGKYEYQYIIHNYFFEDDSHMVDYLKIAQNHLKKGGRFMFCIKNFHSFSNLQHMLNLTNFVDNNSTDVIISPKTSFTTIDHIKKLAEGFDIIISEIIPLDITYKDMNKLPLLNLSPNFYEIIKYDFFIFICTK